jgi:ribosomal protein S18 acetylase RimI-like enzyme
MRKITLKSEFEYLKDHITYQDQLMLLLFVDNKLSGITSIDLRDKIEFHIGGFGISISKLQRGKGLGKLLMKYILDDAIKNLKNLKIITLEVFAVNPNAKKMYEQFGFKEFGLLPGGNYYKETYVDSIFMYKKVK